MNKKKEPTYEELRKKYTDAELVESFVFRNSLSDEEKKIAEEEFLKLRFERLKNMSDEQILQGALMRMKLLMKDYFKQSVYIDAFSFSNQLKKYINLLHKTHSEFASDIGIHKTKLSRILNDKESPNIELMYRLEHHSGGMLAATYWHKLHSRKLEENIQKDEKKRLAEYQRVKNGLKFEFSS